MINQITVFVTKGDIDFANQLRSFDKANPLLSLTGDRCPLAIAIKRILNTEVYVTCDTAHVGKGISYDLSPDAMELVRNFDFRNQIVPGSFILTKKI